MVSMRVQEGQGTSASASSPASASGSGSACTAEGGSISGVRSVIMGSGQTVSSQVTKEGLIGRTHSKHIMKVSMHVCIRFEMIDTFSPAHDRTASHFSTLTLSVPPLGI